MKSKQVRCKPQGYAKDVRTALILDMVGQAIGINNLDSLYLKHCPKETQKNAVKIIQKANRWGR